MSAIPLAGIKVLEFSHTVMGPTAGLVFAELGADVIKIEPAPKGDHTRGLGGFGAGFFAAFNRNKRSLAVDLKRKEGQTVIHRLVPTADVILENFGPGTMERLGCGYEQLGALNPRLVYLALKGYLAGPYEHRPALDEVVQFQTGLAFMTGPPGQPLRAGASVIDIMGAVFGVVAAQAALREREITGRGQRVSSALFESAAFLMSTHMAGMTATGLEARPMPARRGAWAVYEVFKTAADGQLFIGVTSDQHGRGLSRNSGCRSWPPTRASRPMSCGWRSELGSSRLCRRCWTPCRRTRLRDAASAATCRGRRWANRAICSLTRTFWPPAGWSTCLFPALAAATARSRACRHCPSSSASIAGVLAYGASRRAWASTMQSC
jgi:crotonobetainyl-CoA:carnitine CoA-transferase CaiB-like acyl-CoA transferase